MPSFDLFSDAEVAAPKSFDLLSDAVVVPPMSFDLLSDALVLPASAFALTSDAVVSDGLSPITPVPPPDETPPEFPQAPVVNPFACEKQIKACLPCDDDPLLNVSAEDADVDRYIGYGWPVPPPPSLCRAIGSCGHVYFSFGCMGLCFSTVSQEDANQCAINQAQECIGDDPGCLSGCGGGGTGGVGLFQSEAQSCSVACAGGGTFTYYLSAGAVLSFFSVADANKRAKSLACKLAKQFKLCLSIIGSTTSCKNDYTSFVVKATGQLGQYPLNSDWTITGPGLDVNLFTYSSDVASIIGTTEIRIYGTPTITADTYINVRITDNNTGVYMERQIPVTVMACASEYGNITPDIFSNTKSYWNSEDSIPSGEYRVAYVNGAWRPGPLPKWVVGDGGGSPSRGYVIVYNDGVSEVDFPTSGIYDSQAEAEAATAGFSKVITHTGGKIGMYLRDSPYGDNVAGSPNPTFKLEVIP